MMRRTRLQFVALAAALGILAGVRPARADNPFQPAIRAASPSVVKVYVPVRVPPSRIVQAPVASGVILTSDGYIATSTSALAQSRRPTVMLSDGTALAASVVKSDTRLDIAILKVASERLNPVGISATPVRAGQWIVVVANPFGLSQSRSDPLSASVGVVSGLHTVQATDYAYAGPVIVSDVIINPGAPGGAMVDLDGNLVGILGRVITTKRTNTQLSFAVPAAQVIKLLEEARKLAPSLPAPPTPAPPAPAPAPAPAPMPAPDPAPTPAKPAEPGYLGAYIIDEALGDKGAYVDRIVPGSPAENAGIEVGDLIVALNGKPVVNGRQLLQQMDVFGVGTRIELTVRRDKNDVKIAVTLSKAPRSVLR